MANLPDGAHRAIKPSPPIKPLSIASELAGGWPRPARRRWSPCELLL